MEKKKKIKEKEDKQDGKKKNKMLGEKKYK